MFFIVLVVGYIFGKICGVVLIYMGKLFIFFFVVFFELGGFFFGVKVGIGVGVVIGGIFFLLILGWVIVFCCCKCWR